VSDDTKSKIRELQEEFHEKVDDFSDEMVNVSPENVYKYEK